jgi:hypothetical protein
LKGNLGQRLSNREHLQKRYGAGQANRNDDEEENIDRRRRRQRQRTDLIQITLPSCLPANLVDDLREESAQDRRHSLQN